MTPAGALRAAIRSRRTRLTVTAPTLLRNLDWLTYIWAVDAAHQAR